jgi:hypothetical protein
MAESSTPSISRAAGRVSASEGARAFAALLSRLERLAGALADPSSAAGRSEGWRDAAAVRPLVCDAVAQLRTAGATPDEVVTRLRAMVAGLTPPALPPEEAAARVAAIVTWCEEAYPRRREQSASAERTGTNHAPPG